VTIAEQLKAAGLSMADVVKFSGGAITENKLKRVSSGIVSDLGPEDTQRLNRLIAEYRMLMGKVKYVVFEAVSAKVPK